MFSRGGWVGFQVGMLEEREATSCEHAAIGIGQLPIAGYGSGSRIRLAGSR
jgi:hypothetical protein